MSKPNIMAQLFGGANPAAVSQYGQQQPQQQHQQQQQPAQPDSFSKSTNQDPKPSGAATDDGTKSPLADFESLFTIDKPKEGDAPAPEGLDDPLINIDAEALGKVVAQQKFVTDGMRESMAKALQGDEGAMMDLLNAFGRQIFSKAATLNTTVANQSGRELATRLERHLPAKFRELGAKDQVVSKNQLFSDPALAPVVQSIQSQVLRKYPDATPAQVADMVSNYLTTVSKTLAGNSDDPTDRRKPGTQETQDFAAFFGFGD